MLACKCGGRFTNIEVFRPMKTKVKIRRRCTFCKETIETEERPVKPRPFGKYPRGTLPTVVKHMRTQGKTYQEISEIVGYSLSTVWKIGEGLNE